MTQLNLPSSAQLELVSRKTFIRALVVAVVIAAGILTMHVIERAGHFTFVKRPMPLARPLALLSKHFGPSERYIDEGYDENMEEAIVEVLGTRDYLLRTYRDTQKAGQPDELLKLNLNYYPIGSASPHVPEICWAGSGMTEATSSRQIFEVPGVRRKDGSVVTLRVRLISFLPPGESETSNRLKNVAYLFNVNGEYVVTREEVVSRFWKASNLYAYHTKIEVTVGDPRQFCSQEQARAAVADFLRASISQIEECLPGPATAKSATVVPGSSQAVPGVK
jgi:hypothetical protein